MCLLGAHILCFKGWAYGWWQWLVQPKLGPQLGGVLMYVCCGTAACVRMNCAVCLSGSIKMVCEKR